MPLTTLSLRLFPNHYNTTTPQHHNTTLLQQHQQQEQQFIFHIPIDNLLYIMHISYIGIIGVLLSTVIGTTIPSLDDNALSSPILDTRAAGGGHFLVEFSLGTTEDEFKELKEKLPKEFPKVLFRWTKMETVRVKKTATVTLTEKNRKKVKEFLDNQTEVFKATWVADNDQGLMDKRTP
jgi:hypothetical protein